MVEEPEHSLQELPVMVGDLVALLLTQVKIAGLRADQAQCRIFRGSGSRHRTRASGAACDCTRRRVGLVSVHVVFWQIQFERAGRRDDRRGQRLFAGGAGPAG